MSDRKTHYHIEVDREKAALIWSFLSENFDAVIAKEQHSPDGNDLHIYLRIIDIK